MLVARFKAVINSLLLIELSERKNSSLARWIKFLASLILDPRGWLSAGGALRIITDKFRVREGESVSLKKWPTLVKPAYASKEDFEKVLSDHVAQLSQLQKLHYASNQNALLLIFQGMDGAGKDGTIRHVMSGVNPQGCQVFSFKHPSATELEHDFLWRTTRDLPERGRIGIFNRSYYEEVLIARVHPEILKAEGLKHGLQKAHKKKSIWNDRYRSIVDLEAHLYRNGTKIIKFFLHLSHEEQTDRFLGRVDDPEKNWKLSPDDIAERVYWKEYMKAYEECLAATSTKHAPWYAIPADDKLNARLIVSQVVIDVFKGFNMRYPTVRKGRQEELELIRKQLLASKK
jgi:PPK2 family polyphosphate:nucleotide phosphotransferase